MKKFLEFLKNPRPWFSVIVVAVLLFSAPASIYMAITETYGVVFYAVCVAAALSLGYFVYLAILFSRNAKNIFYNAVNKYSFTKKLAEDYSYRTAVTSLMSFVINAGYAVFMGIFGIMYRLIWYGALATYYLVLSFLRIVILLSYGKAADEEKNLKVYKRTGFFISLLAVAMIPAVVQMVMSRRLGMTGVGVMIYVIATYTTYKITFSVINAFKAKKTNDKVIMSLKYVNLADSAFSLVSLQTALVAIFSESGDTVMPVFNAVTGGAACLFVLLLGISIVVSSNKVIGRFDK